MGDMWGSAPAADVVVVSSEPAPPYFWDHSPDGGAAALRHPDGRVLLMIVADGDSWGIYQLQCCGVAVYKSNSESEWELIQIRGTKEAARDAAIEMAKRVGLLA